MNKDKFGPEIIIGMKVFISIMVLELIGVLLYKCL